MPMYYEFEVSIRDISPRIWRRFLLHGKATFEDLHLAIQDASVWQNYQPYLFRADVEGPVIARKDDVVLENWPEPLGKDVPLSSFFTINGGYPPVTACMYEYTLDEGWLLDVSLRKRVRTEERFHRRLLSGACAFPPEDCRGMWGYLECVRVVKEADESGDPDWGDKDGWFDFLQGWRPETFDPATIGERFNR